MLYRALILKRSNPADYQELPLYALKVVHCNSIINQPSSYHCPLAFLQVSIATIEI